MEPTILRRLREAKGSLFKASAESGIPPESLSRYERGLRIPSYPTAVKLGRYLGISTEEVQRLAYEAKKVRRGQAS